MTDSGYAVYDVNQIRRAEQLARAAGIDDAQLMLRAASAAWRELQALWPQAKRLLVLCGKGNNGGDGYLLAYLAHINAYPVDLVALEPPAASGAARQAYERCLKIGLTPQTFAAELLHGAELVIDGVFGIGFKGDIAEPLASIFQSINQSVVPVFALDCPSGLSADNTQVNANMLQADVTMSFIGLKPGLLTGDTAAYAGQVLVDDLGLGDVWAEQLIPCAVTSEYEDYRHLIMPRPSNSHKGDFGHVLVIGGQSGFVGAACLAAGAALRCGAGLVSVASQAAAITVINSHFPEVMVHPVANARELKPLLAKATVVVIGPGLGQSDWGQALWQAAREFSGPKVIDADALNVLASSPQAVPNAVLTPHPGEAARLLQTSVSDIMTDRLKTAKALQDRYQAHIVLKGQGTIVQSLTSIPSICLAGNPGMASGGMGDVLSGVIASLIAQGIEISIAAHMGVALHAAVADLAAMEGERGMLAQDVLAYLRELMN